MTTEDKPAQRPENTERVGSRRKVVQTHFTQEEYDKLREFCHVNRYSMSELMRERVLAHLGSGEEETSEQMG